MKLVKQARVSLDSYYLPVVLCCWCFAPGLRRIVDWQFGRNPLSILSVLPMLSLLPLAVVVYRNAASPRLRLPFRTLAYFWLFGFVYALVVALTSGGRAGALYDFAEFCVPMLLGAWIIVRPASRAKTFAQLSTTLLWIAGIESLYGLVQFVSPPPWDVAYVNDLNQGSLGVPEPFGLHPFAMLNSHATLSVFLVAAMLTNMHRLDLRRPLPLLVTVLSVAVLILTTVRSSWLALAIGVLTYLVLSPKRGKAIFALGAVGVISFALLVNASTILGNSDVTNLLTARFSTLGSVDQDVSVADREQQTVYAMKQGLSEPLGQGLGTVGTSTWLEGSSGDGKVSLLVLDDGYIARFLEMGVAGCACYIATLVFGIVFGYRALLIGIRTRNTSLQQIAVAGLSLQAALVGLDLSGDSHSLLAGLFFWIALGTALRFESKDETRRSAWETAGPSTPLGRGAQLWA